MSATILKFTPKPNPIRDQQRLVEAMYDATWAPFFAWADLIDFEMWTEPKAEE